MTFWGEEKKKESWPFFFWFMKQMTKVEMCLCDAGKWNVGGFFFLLSEREEKETKEAENISV